MDTELWIRNPNLFIRECEEESVRDFTWDHGLLKKRRIDLAHFMDLYYGPTKPWNAMIISELGACLINPDNPIKNPEAVFPVWKYGEPWHELEELAANPIGLSEKACDDESLPGEWRPRYGQSHRVIISYTPMATTNIGRGFFRSLAELQSEYPDCKIHVHGVYSFRVNFGLEFASVDFEPRSIAAKGGVVLPNGKHIDIEDLHEYAHWIEMLGFHVRDMKVPRNRCIYNLRSAKWASEHFRENLKFKYKGFERIDPDDPLLNIKGLKRNKSVFVKRVVPQPDDKFLCNVCSLKSYCKYYRVGAVCSVPDSEPAQLALFFKTRDSDQILEGMKQLLEIEATRIKDARQAETDNEEINPEVTRMLNNIFVHAEKFVKLIDPSLRTPGAVVTSNTLNLTAGMTPQAMAAKVIEYLVGQGIPRGEITSDMVMHIIDSPGDNLEQKAIEAATVLRVNP